MLTMLTLVAICGAALVVICFVLGIVLTLVGLPLALLLGGAVGNLIDRALLGFVTDMFETTFVHFAIFNVADIGVVVGGILLCLHVIFAFGKGWKEEKEEEENP